ncbi:MAG: hypothetical protein QM500_08625 [Methylococcales bacterium]
MRNEITKFQARIIVGQIRRRRSKVALFSAPLGIKLKPVSKCSDAQLGDIDFIGIYNKRVSYEQVFTDWNESI